MARFAPSRSFVDVAIETSAKVVVGAKVPSIEVRVHVEVFVGAGDLAFEFGGGHIQ